MRPQEMPHEADGPHVHICTRAAASLRGDGPWGSLVFYISRRYFTYLLVSLLFLSGEKRGP